MKTGKVFLAVALVSAFLAGCAITDTDRPDNQMRKSPCASVEVGRG